MTDLLPTSGILPGASTGGGNGVLEGAAVFAALHAANKVRAQYKGYQEYCATVGPKATFAGFQQWTASLKSLSDAQPRKGLFGRQAPTQGAVQSAWDQHLFGYR